MAADSAGCTVTTVVTCEGDLSDPGFLGQFDLVLDKLQGLLGEPLKVHKLEPWNSVRVTLSIPREAALRLRQLANDGSQQLRALGILSVQVEGDQVISLRLAGTATSEPQEIILRTGQDGSAASTSGTSLSQLLAGPSEPAVPPEKVQFRSPNVVCPPDTIVPKVPVPSAASVSTPPTPTKGYAGPFPFTSMNQAMHSSRDSTNVATAATAVTNGPAFTAPPPPYPGKHPPVTLSSPLLVNLLQNEGGTSAPPRTVNPPPPPEPTECVQTVATVTTTQRMPSAFATAAAAVNKTLPMVRTPQITVNTTINNIQPSISALNSVTAPPHSNSSKVLYVNNIQNTVLPRQVPKLPKEVPTNSMVSSPNGLASTNVTRNPVPYLYPPPYPNTATTTTRQWEQTVQPMPQLQELVPTLADLKADDLDHLLPSLERDLASSPLNLPEFLSDTKSRTVYLINPLTGELEPQSHSDSDEEVFRDVFTGLPSPANISDEDTNSTIRPDTTDQSDSESRSCHSDSSKHSKLKIGRSREKGRDSPSISKPTEKIKLRLKLEKSEPVSPAYKVDVSFINTPQPKKAVTGTGEELRVPPLHISLRGRNHVVINNKKKLKLNPDGTPVVKAKPKKLQDHVKVKKDEDMVLQGGDITSIEQSSDYSETRKLKKPKLNHDTGKDKIQVCPIEVDTKKELLYNNLHYTEKLMLRRGSDSDLARNSKKYTETNGIILEEKKRRLSQTEDNFDHQQPSTTTILGSTNTGTVTSIATHKVRKEKSKFKENFKNKDLNRFKSYSKNIAEKLNNTKQIPLPTGEIDMEAKFKQRLMEDQIHTIPCIPHRTEMVIQKEPEEKLVETLEDPPALKDKPPEPDKCNTPDRKPDLQDKQPNRSPNSGAQGEDSGIESMDALSEKSPNQASQSPHAEISEPIKSKTQVPDILDIEAQLAKMEGLHGEDLNENHSSQTKLEQCCVLTTALQDSLSKGAVTLTHQTSPGIKEQVSQVEISLVPLKSSTKQVVCNKESGKGDDLEPLPLRVTPPLYTYSNPEKRSPDSPTLSDSDSNLCNPLRKSLLEQLLIEIPENPTPSSPSPATRSVRTRASSKMNSPELNSPVVANNKAKVVCTTKRKRNESDSSNHSLEEQRNKKPRKCSENAAELIKACMGVEAVTKAIAATPPALTTKKKVQDESSDSDEPLIEVAGKVRKNTQTAAVVAATTPAPAPATTRVKLKSNNAAAAATTAVAAVVAPPPTPTAQPGVKAASVNTRRSIRTMPVINTRSKGDKSNPDSDVIRRKTRSAVSEGEGKRRKDIK